MTQHLNHEMQINYFKQGDLVYCIRHNGKTRVGVVVGESKMNTYAGSGKAYPVLLEGYVSWVCEFNLVRTILDVQGNY
jgi:hypothetical protein